MTKECECAAHSAVECCCGAWDEPQRTWVGLTKEDIKMWRSRFKFSEELIKEVEAKLKEKNT